MEEQQELPQGWIWTTVNQLGKSVTGNTPSTSNPEFYGGPIPFFKPGDLGSGYAISEAETNITEAGAASARILPPYSILVTCIGATIGKTGFSTVAGATNQQINALVPAAAVVVPQFAYFGFISPVLYRQIIDNASSTTLPILNKSKFEALAFPLPPLPEQRRIVAKLEELFSKLDAGVAAVRRTQALLKRYRQSVLHAAVTGELTRAWREAHPAPAETGAALLERIRAERRAQWEAAQVAKRGGQLPLGDGWKSKYVEPGEPDTSELPDLPEGWAVARLDIIASLKGGVTKDSKRQHVESRSVPYLRVANVQRGYLDLTEIKEIEASEEAIRDLALQYGDVLFNEGGDLDKLGRGWIWENQVPECIHQNHVFRARTYLPEMASRLISYWGNSFGQLYFMRVGKQTTNLASINLSKLSEFPVPLPPLAEQEQIVVEVEARISVLDKLEQTLTDELKRAERLRQSILHRAFTGRLVPQDATDEPAAALLARLREAPATSARAKPARGRKAVAQQPTLGL
ncbi:restriction endonuclease subunit S [Hymenobacter sp. BT683]|uniref:Restriction endonuclease subunit S n=1 Tax=Hymenobacter jeongseonensis TaxID=2791027 RepID=A0ABS0INS9_9BACT|nr:restriction endonuclease subunit S [Hymenobacter jeongseonensis]MBF9239420.1 restriction endonuclease subunit S [Hymenobacter jeongseonensis]